MQRALVAPFLARRIWDRPPFCVDLVCCSECGFMFYNPRLDASEEARLYKGYRTQEYQQGRHASEPWYTARFNAGLASLSSYELRRRAVREVLAQHIGGREIRRILDYGGDRGDLVDGLVDGAAAFVYDISGIPPADGVTSITDPATCNPDLIVNSNVLEHVGSPRRLLSEMLKIAPSGGLIFIEVPSETPLGTKRIIRRLAQVGIMSLLRPALIRHVIRPASLFMMHEHINYFTERSLTKLMHVCGGTVAAAGTYTLAGTLEKEQLAWCLAVVKEKHS